MEIKYNNILIFGYSRSGKSVERFLKNHKKNYKIYDEKINDKNSDKFITKLSKSIIKNFDLIILSPGVSIYHKKIKLAQKYNIKIVSELEFASWFINSKIIAITGTNGKTTTCKILNSVLKIAGYDCATFGNIGTPLSDAIGTDFGYIVCEVSSFQLEAVDTFTPYIACVLNISEDHIDRHKTFENYVKNKLKLINNYNNIKYILIDNDSVEYSKIYIHNDNKILQYDKNYNINTNVKNCEKIQFLNGIYIKNEILELTPSKNIFAIIEILKLLKIDPSLINEIKIEDAKEHRFEKFLLQDGIAYINDSKATNPGATINAIEHVDSSVILLLGGSDKNMKFDDLINKVIEKNIVVILFGSASIKLHKLFKKKKYKNCYRFKTLYDALQYSSNIAREGDSVLLSPACASFDEFKNYEERGRFFKEKILEILREKNEIKK